MNILDRLPWEVLGPLVFLIVAVVLVLMCPDDKKGELIFLVTGAALTRVKITANGQGARRPIPQAPIEPRIEADKPPDK